MASETTIEHVWGELTGNGKTQNVNLQLTIKEMFVDENPAPIARAVARHELTPMSGIVVEDGKYTLRYQFDGKQQEHSVRVLGGRLLAGID